MPKISRTEEYLRSCGIAREDWAIVYIKAETLVQKGKNWRAAIRVCHNQLRGLSRLDRDLLAA